MTINATKSTAMDGLYDEDMERAVIGSVMIRPQLFVALAVTLRDTDFFLLRHQYIWQALAALNEQQQPLERQHIRRQLGDRFEQIGGDVYLSELVNSTPSALYAQQYAELIRRDAVRRRLAMAAEDLRQLASNRQISLEDVAAQSQHKLMDVFERDASPTQTTLKQSIGNVIQELGEAQKADGRFGLPIGFRQLDALFGGWTGGQSILLAGRPGMGKTALALCIAVNAARHFDARVGFFSMEMANEELTRRVLGQETGVNFRQLMSGQSSNAHAENKLVLEASERLMKYHLIYDDAPALTPETLRLKAMLMKHTFGLDLLIVDYIQLMSAPGFNNNRVAEMSYISRQQKELARTLNIPVLTLSQLNRDLEKRTDKRPKLSDLRDSGSLEQDADIVMFVYRDGVYNDATEHPNQADVIVAKHRNGATATIPLYFDATSMRFTDGKYTPVDLSSL